MAQDGMNQHRILVLGGGYSGIACAIRVAMRRRHKGDKVTLVNPATRFTERLRMHQVATGQELANHQIPEMLVGTDVEFIQGWATEIDAEAQQVRVSDAGKSRTLGYDTLVCAIGSVADTAALPGAAEHAYTLDSAQEATRLAVRLAELEPRGGVVTICGGGLTGVEAATEIAEAHPGVRVVLLSRDVPGSLMGDKARDYLHGALDRLGVEVRAGTEAVGVRPDAVELADGEQVPFQACLWTAGVRVSSLAAYAGIAVDPRGRIVVDGTLRSTSHPTVYAVGDAAAIRQAWGEIHGTCQSGMPTAAYAADVIARRLAGQDAKPFRFGYIHQPVSLGRGDAVVQFTHPDDSPRRWILTGKRAVAYKEFMSSSPPKTYRMLKRFPGALLWSHGGRTTRQPVAF